MGWQLVLVVLAVAAALAYLGRGAWRTWKGRPAGCGGCKCAGGQPAAGGGQAPAELIPVEQLTARLRPRP